MASDGLWDVVNNGDVANVLSSTFCAMDASQELVKLSLKRNSHTADNISVVTVALRWNVDSELDYAFLNDLSSTAPPVLEEEKPKRRKQRSLSKSCS